VQTKHEDAWHTYSNVQPKNRLLTERRRNGLDDPQDRFALHPNTCDAVVNWLTIRYH
jgi:hypothetical protein